MANSPARLTIIAPVEGFFISRAIWRRILDAAINEVLLAVDLYNRPREERRLEAFFVHMHVAWLYLLHAHFRRAGVDYRYRHSGSNRFVKVDGEPKTWELAKSVSEHWPDADHPVRKNLELTGAIRNKIEHRFTDADLDIATSGFAQASLLNFESELVALFGEKFSLSDSLRFPVFIGTFTRLSAQQMKAAKDSLPAEIRSLIDDFQIDMDSSTAEDSRYEFRVNLVRQIGPKTEADLALNFVREDELSDEDREVLQKLGRTGTVIVREQQRPVSSADKLRASDVVAEMAPRVPFEFNMHHFVQAWKRLQVRPSWDDDKPERTKDQYCVYDTPHRDYVYTQAFCKKIARECQTEEGFRQLTGAEPRPKADIEGSVDDNA